MKKLCCMILAFLFFFTGCLNANTPQGVNGKEEVQTTERVASTPKELNAVAQDIIKRVGEPASGLRIRRLDVGDIPAIEVCRPDGKKKPLMIITHGGGGCKEDFLETAIWEAISKGVYTVIFDVGGYGESSRGGMSDIEGIVQSIDDLNALVEYYKDQGEVDTDKLILRGCSMGGTISMLYPAFGKYKPFAIVSELPCVDFSMFGEDSPIYSFHGDEAKRSKPQLDNKQIKALADQYNPFPYAKKYLGIAILTGTGLEDSSYNPLSNKALESKLKELGHQDATFLYYTGHGHELPEAFYQKADKWLEAHLYGYTSPKIEKTAVQSQSATYKRIDQLGSYSDKIITSEILKACRLGEVNAAALPAWKGYILENKISVNYKDERWNDFTGGPYYWVEDEIKYLAENGFNCARVVYSLSFLGKPNDPSQINIQELEQLDELIAWGMKHNVHIMLSITGLPNKWNTSWENEGVQSNGELFENTITQGLYSQYMELLAKRYANIPSGVLSFELLAEPAVPDGNLELYEKVLTPVIDKMWKYSPERILVVNDVYKQVPYQLAAKGCCLSLHTHIYNVDQRRFQEEFNIHTEPKWPMPYLPMNYNEESGQLTLKSEKGFKEGQLVIYYLYEGRTLAVYDGAKCLQGAVDYANQGKATCVKVPIKAGVKDITLKPEGAGQLLAVSLEQKDEETLTIPTHSLYGMYVGIEPLPTIAIKEGQRVENQDNPPHVLDADYFSNTYLKPFIDCAEENKVSFIMTEIGTDTLDLTPDQYVAYHEQWLLALKKNNIGWMYNCVHNILAPKGLMWLNENNSSFIQFSKTSIPNYSVNDKIMNLLKKYK